MEFKTLEFPILVTKFKKHLELKEKLLKSIDQGPGSAVFDSFDSISKTDWNIGAEIHRPYLDILSTPLLDHLKEAYLPLNSSGFQIHNFWFQQYKENSTHDWHTHQASQFTNIYYLELPKTAPKTEFLNPLNFDEVIKIDAEEGDIVTLPSFIFHRSPPVNGDIRKTIISFNISLLKLAISKKAD